VMAGKNEVKNSHGYFKLLPLQISGGSMWNHANNHLTVINISAEIMCSIKVHRHVCGNHYYNCL
jgi:hypothetical protein